MLRLRTFGGLSLDENGQPCARAQVQRRRLALLALLAVAGERGLSRDKIYLYLWPESDPDRARNALNQSVFAVRRDLGSDVLETAGGELRLNRELITSDVAELRTAIDAGLLERAATLYGGPFLDGVHLAEAPEFERWVSTEREHFARVALGALKTLATEAAGRGDHEVAAGWWRRLAAIDPLNTSAAIGLMNALAAAGDRAAALRHMRVHETLLREELGAAPDATILALGERLRSVPNPEAVGSLVRAPLGVPTDVEATGVSPTDVDARDVDAAADLVPPATSVSDADSTNPAATPTRPRLRRLGLVATAITLGIVAVAVMARTGADSPPRPTVAVLDPKRVLVAPFENRTGDRALEPLGPMAADWIIYGLARTSLVEVVDSRTLLDALPRDSSTADSARAIAAAMRLAQKTGAASVVWGSYYRHGDSLRLQARILDTRAGTVVRMLAPVGAHVENPTPALERIRSEVMGALAALSDPRFAAWATGTSDPPNYKAYQAYVLALELASRRKWQEALPHFVEAARLDTNFVQARLFAAESFDAVNDSRAADSVLRTLAARRSELAPYDQANFDRLSSYVAGDWQGTLVGARRMAALAPASPEANYSHGWAALANNRFEEALAAFARVDRERGWMKDWAWFIRWPTTALHFLGSFERELAEFRRAQQQFPNEVNLCSGSIRPLAALGRVGDLRAPIEQCAALPEMGSDGPIAVRQLAASELIAHGHAELARPLCDTVVALTNGLPDSTRFKEQRLASVLAECGRWTEARPIYERELAGTPANLHLIGQVGVANAFVGNRDVAEAMMQRIPVVADTSQEGKARNRQAFRQRARIAAAMGDKEQAVAFLQSAIDLGVVPVFGFHRDRALEALRGYAPYEQLFKPRD